MLRQRIPLRQITGKTLSKIDIPVHLKDSAIFRDRRLFALSFVSYDDGILRTAGLAFLAVKFAIAWTQVISSINEVVERISNLVTSVIDRPVDLVLSIVCAYHRLDGILKLIFIDRFVIVQSQQCRCFEDQSIIHDTGHGVYLVIAFEVAITSAFDFHALTNTLMASARKTQWRKARLPKTRFAIIMHDEVESSPIDLHKESDVQSADECIAWSIGRARA